MGGRFTRPALLYSAFSADRQRLEVCDIFLGLLTAQGVEIVQLMSGSISRKSASRRTLGAGFALLLLGLLLGLVAASTAPSSAFGQQSTTTTTAPSGKSGQVTFGIQPASNGKPDGRGFFLYGAGVGSHLTDYVAIIDYSYQPLKLTLESSDIVNTTQGNLALQGQLSPLRDLGKWIQIPSAYKTVEVPARGYVIVPFTLVVPAGATPGDHAGGILATLASSVTSPSGQRLKLLQNVGVRMFARVSGPLNPRLSITNLKADYQDNLNPIGDGSVTVTYVVSNTGNVALGGRQNVWVTGLFGTKSRAKSPPNIPLLIPGSSLKERVVVPGVFPAFLEHAHVSIYPLIIPGTTLPPTKSFSAQTSFFAIPWILVAIVAAFVLVVIGWIWRRRRRRRRLESPSEPATPDDGSSGVAAAVDSPVSEARETGEELRKEDEVVIPMGRAEDTASGPHEGD
jgi:hypothetical protein